MVSLPNGSTYTRSSNHPNSFSGITATGGNISEYESGGNFYRAHIFTGSSTFEVTNTADSSYGTNVEYLVVAGGGGGGGHTVAAGGGAGGLRTNLSGHPYATSEAFPAALLSVFCSSLSCFDSFTLNLYANRHVNFKLTNFHVQQMWMELASLYLLLK